MGNGNNQYTLKRMVEQARSTMLNTTTDLPYRATTKGQRRLLRKHGSPRAFARGVTEAIGEISVDEAEAAILKYKTEWEAA